MGYRPTPPSFALRKARTRARKWYPLFVESARRNEAKNDFCRRTGMMPQTAELNARVFGHVWALPGDRMARAPARPSILDVVILGDEKKIYRKVSPLCRNKGKVR